MDRLADLADQWLEPELSRARRRADLERIDVAAALHRLVPWSQRLDAVAPERVEVPSGSRIRMDYSGEQPVLAVKLQELFGWDGDAAHRGRSAADPPAVPRRTSGGGHRGPGVVLARGLPCGPRGAARPLPQAPLARGPTHRDPTRRVKRKT